MDVTDKSSRLLSESEWRIGGSPNGGEKRHLHTPPIWRISVAIPQNTFGDWKKWPLCGVRGEWEFRRGQNVESNDAGVFLAEHMSRLSPQGWTCAACLSPSSCCVGSSKSQALWFLQLGDSFMRVSLCCRAQLTALLLSFSDLTGSHGPHYGHFHGERESSGLLGDKGVPDLAW